MLRRIVQALMLKARERKGSPPWIAFTSEGFELRKAESLVGGVEWSEIRKIVAFKRDLVTTDAVCLEFHLVGRDGVFEVNDDVGGFWELVGRVKEVFPGSDQDWEATVVRPAFARNARVIFEAPGCA